MHLERLSLALEPIDEGGRLPQRQVFGPLDVVLAPQDRNKVGALLPGDRADRIDLVRRRPEGRWRHWPAKCLTTGLSERPTIGERRIGDTRVSGPNHGDWPDQSEQCAQSALVWHASNDFSPKVKKKRPRFAMPFIQNA